MTIRRHSLAQRGAALLTAMVIVALVATLGAAMIWQQWRAVQVEAAERSRVQAWWILTGALDWARLILVEDEKNGGPDHLGEPWATPLAEARLSTFLAVDRDRTDDAPEAFLSGSIADMQARYNLRNLIDGEGRISKVELKSLQRLCELAGVPASVADSLAASLQQALLVVTGLGAARAGADVPPDPNNPPPQLQDNPPVLPSRIDDLTWLGLDAYTVGKLKPYLALLPQPTPINLNTAPKEVIAAVIDGLDLASAERLVQGRQSAPLKQLSEAAARLGLREAPDASRANVTSSYFEVRGRLRLEDRTLEQRYLVERRLRRVFTLQQERMAGVDGGGGLAPAR